MSLTRQVVSGVKWSAAGRYGEQLLVLLATAILARLLAPDDFGVFGMALLASTAFTVVADLGTGTALVQRETISAPLISSVFWLNVGLGVLYCAVAYVAAPLVALFFTEPLVAPVLRVLAGTLVLGGISAVPQALLVRRLAFDRLAGAQLLAVALGAFAGVAMAVAGFGVWSLVGQQLTRGVAEAGLLLLGARLRPSPVLRVDELRGVRQFSLSLTGAQIGSYLIRNLDNILIGRVLGSTLLGYYDIAWRLIQYPLVAVTSVANRVLLPALSRLQTQEERFALAYLRSSAAVAFVSAPAMVVLFVLAEPTVRLLLGEAWVPAAPLVMVLAPVGLFQSVGAMTGNLYVARGATGRLLAWTLLAAPVTAAALLFGVRFGVTGVAISRLVANTLLSPLNFLLAAQGTSLRLRDLAKALKPVALASTVVGVVAVAARLGLESLGIQQPVVIVLVGSALGVLAYIGILMASRPRVLGEILETLGLAGVPGTDRLRHRMRQDMAPDTDRA
jgi:PST family polysaccharide transporter